MLKKLREQKIIFDILNVVLGLTIILLLILTFIYQENKYLLITAFYVGSIMNLMNGAKKLLEDKKKTGIYFIVVAVLIFISATLLL